MATSYQHQRAGDLNFLKRLNRSAILEMVRRAPGLTRTDIATQAQLTKATVGTGVQFLLNQGWLKEGDLQKSSGGRPGRALYFNDERHYLLGAEIGVHQLRLVACAPSGKVLEALHEPFIPTTPESTAALLAQLLRQLMRSPAVAHRENLGISVALPGTIATGDAVLRRAPNLGWKNVRFLDLLRPYLPELKGVLLMDNEAKSAAFGELYFRTGKIPESLLYISAGTGIGSGMVEGSHSPILTRGVQGLAGEIGHTILQPGGPYCHCGNRGCAETLVSGWSIRATLGIDEKADLIPTIESRLQEPEVIRTLCRAGEAMGMLVLNLHHTLNPAEIVLGGSLTQLGNTFLEPALTYFDANQHRLLGETQRVPLRIVDDSTFVVARGAASQVLARAIHGPELS